MTTLYRPTDALTPEDRKVPGILITQYPRAMYLVPIEAEEETVVAIEPGNPYAEASMDSDGNVWFGGGIFPVDVTEKFNQWASKNQRTRYVTPWEVA